MTKILYIPTGEYIKFLCIEYDLNTATRTEIYEKSSSYSLGMSVEGYISRSIQYNYSSYIKEQIGSENNPIREEFEIIYD